MVIVERPQEKSIVPLAPESPFDVNRQPETSVAVERVVPPQPRSVDSYAPNSAEDADTLPPAYDTLIAAGPSTSAPTQDTIGESSRNVSMQNSKQDTHPMVHMYYSSSDQYLTNPPEPGPSLSRKLSSSEHLAPILPSSFSRSPPTTHSYPSFSSMSLDTIGVDLDSGFPETLPPSLENPHPFISHDVTGSDWRRFLVDIKRSAKLSTGQKATAVGAAGLSNIPVIGLFVGPLAHTLIRHMKGSKRKPVGILVDVWNHHFFQPRKMEIILARGPARIDSGEGLVPHVTRFQENNIQSGGEDKQYRLFIVPI